MKTVFQLACALALGVPMAAWAAALPAPSQVAINLAWSAPASSLDPVAGYNAYRAPNGSAAYAVLNTLPIPGTSYQDLTVQQGQTYVYIVESVDAEGNTSAPSNTATVLAPTVWIPSPLIVGTLRAT